MPLLPMSSDHVRIRMPDETLTVAALFKRANVHWKDDGLTRGSDGAIGNSDGC